MLYNIIALGLLPIAAGLASYVLTEAYFREKLIPYPFERYGLVIAAGMYFLVLAFFLSVKAIIVKRSPRT